MPSFTKALPRLGGGLVPKPAVSVTDSGKSDLLMRFFESDWFDAWIALTYLYKSTSPGVLDYLCNRLYTLPERDVETYLSQLTQLCMLQPNSSLERVLIDLCSRSLRIAVKTYWLLLAISQDNPTDTHVIALRDRCEQAALEGTWDLPFKDSRLPPLRLPGAGWALSTPVGRAPVSRVGSPAPGGTGLAPLPGAEGECLLPGAVASFSDDDAGGSPLGGARYATPRPMSPDGIGSGIYSSVFMDAGMEGLLGYEANGDSSARDRAPEPQGAAGERAAGAEDAAARRAERRLSLRLQASEIAQSVRSADATTPGAEGPSPGDGLVADGVLASDGAPASPSPFLGDDAAPAPALSPPNSPHRRQTTFGATLDFIDALCTASSGLTAFPGRGPRIEQASRKGVAVWFPMGRRVRRVVRLAERESVLLNSREKAPFTLYVEVLDEDTARRMSAEGDERDELPRELFAGGDALASDTEDDARLLDSGDNSSPTSSEASRASAMAELAVRSSSGGDLGSRPGGASAAGVPARRATAPSSAASASPRGSPASEARSSSTAASSLIAASLAGRALWRRRGRGHLDRARAARAARGQRRGLAGAQLGPDDRHGPPRRRPRRCRAGERARRPSGSAAAWPAATPSRRAWPRRSRGLRGDAPLVRLHLEVLGDAPESEDEEPSLSSAEDDEALRRVARRKTMPAALPSPAPARCAASARPLARRPRCTRSRPRRARSKSTPVDGAAPPSPTPDELAVTCGKNGRVASLSDAEDRCDTPLRSGSGSRRLPSLLGSMLRDSSQSSSRKERAPQPHEALLKVARKHRLPAPMGELLAVPEQPAPAEEAAGGVVTPAAAAQAAGVSASNPAPSAAATKPRPFSSEERVYGENWSRRRARVQAQSPHGARPGWDLACVIVKAGDDCRQELLAMQLIDAFREIWEEARLPLFLKTYEVLVTSNRTALIELVPNAPSIHADRYGEPGSPGLLAAQRNFVESMAAYSLVCYALQIKDRHNGNILLDDQGHIIHIDFGFMLTNSPGGVNFESVPFKLTRELLEVMDSGPGGETSELFDYFKVLMIQGFLAVRRHADRIILLVEMMSSTGCPCFKNRAAAVAGLRKRFQLGLPEPALVEMVLGLISESLDAWRTRQYDYYQRVLNGVL
ncbi:hypothetical protein QBZ16_000895 [Prototheca wickerhamii]|uniref:1-phosphatidylinositol 4-kinase n=1 Tax=Prototheca wickerhamii TaxID=3111 RepID=A0AAD9IGU7_PROWI|nr:hypothetical protein QBZ16_000895 [Prototheca wickerhamii]